MYVLAKAFTINRRTVSAILGRHGIRRRYNLLDADAVADAARLYGTGWSLARLADHLGVTARTMQLAFVKAGIPLSASRNEPVDEPDMTSGELSRPASVSRQCWSLLARFTEICVT